MIKGALFTLQMHPFMNLCLRTWRHQAAFMIALSRAQYDEKVTYAQPDAALRYISSADHGNATDRRRPSKSWCARPSPTLQASFTASR